MAGDFLRSANGTGGVIGTARTVTWTTSLNALNNGIMGISDTTADTGIFALTSFSSCMLVMAEFSHITNTLTPTAGGCLIGWWLGSRDNGSTFESTSTTTPSATVPAIARPPDMIIPLYTGGTATTAGNLFQSPVFQAPRVKSKLVVQNMSGANFSANAHTLVIWGVADGYT